MAPVAVVQVVVAGMVGGAQVAWGRASEQAFVGIEGIAAGVAAVEAGNSELDEEVPAVAGVEVVLLAGWLARLLIRGLRCRQDS